jgi:hypothetical protein
MANANALLKELISEDRKRARPNLKSPDNFYNHSKGVSNVSYMVGCSILYNRADYMDAGLAGVAGLLHDIGKVVSTEDEREKDPELIFDSYYGSRFLEKLGYCEIADVIRPAFTTKELMELRPGIVQEGDAEADRFIPRTLEQKVVVYADARTTGYGSYVSLDMRIKDITQRYPEESLLVRSLYSGGEERLRCISREIEEKAGLLI